MKIARINFGNISEDEYRAKCKLIKAELEGIQIFQSGTGFTHNWWFGNYCLYGVPHDKAVELASKYNLSLDMVKPILEASDIDGIQVGDKVTISKDNMFSAMFSEQGTVVEKTSNSVIVRKYRSKNKGWELRVGEVGSIAAGW